jgi:uncharacterized phage protein (TIGR02218 family)
MKSLPYNLLTHIQTGNTTLAFALKIVRKDNFVLAVTSADVSFTDGSHTYNSFNGLDVTSIELAVGLSVDNLELSTIDDGYYFEKNDILSYVWEGAEFTLSRYNWESPADGLDTIMVGIVGNITIHDGYVTAELRGLQQFLQQSIGAVTSRTCRARLGDSACTVNLVPYTYTTTVIGTSTSIRTTFTAELPGALDWYTEGLVTWGAGSANAGSTYKVKSSSESVGSNVIIQLNIPTVANIAIGDTLTIVVGCRKRLTEDCKAKFNNVLNFQGEPHLPGADTMTSSPLI